MLQCLDNDTDEVCRSFKDKRIQHHKHEGKKGVPAARNKGLDLATGDYVMSVDDDDKLVANT